MHARICAWAERRKRMKEVGGRQCDVLLVLNILHQRACQGHGNIKQDGDMFRTWQHVRAWWHLKACKHVQVEVCNKKRKIKCKILYVLCFGTGPPSEPSTPLSFSKASPGQDMEVSQRYWPLSYTRKSRLPYSLRQVGECSTNKQRTDVTFCFIR